ncbi:MAG: DUF3043 domain-containing protein [Actinomycetes bacterium]
MFRRRPATDPATAADQAQPVRRGAKGRPTPKRREAERLRRRRARTPRNRKDAVRQSRGRAREERTAMRRALVTGDERNLPPRDQGPARSFTRDWIDSKRRPGELFLPGAIVVFVLNLVPSPAVKSLGVLLWLLMILAIAGASIALVRSVKREMARRLPRESTRGLAAYTILRSLQIRRLRLPPPRVKPGTKV